MPPSPWNLAELAGPPQTFPASGLESEGVEALFFEGPWYRGNPTRTFAYLGFPERAEGEKVPAMVLVHGGGGTAFADWVRLWNARGYAAIAMDTCGAVPNLEDVYGPPIQHEHAGPSGWGGFDQIDEPVEDQWTYHAISNVLLAHSLLRAQLEVDETRIGITGVSWGGYLTCIAAAADGRFQCAASVYGCGFLGEKSTWLSVFQDMGSEKAEKWLSLWDPSQHIARAQMPFLYVNGTNDFAYPLSSAAKTYALLDPGQVTYCIKIRMEHGHNGPGENPEEIHAFANSILKGGQPLARMGGLVREGNEVSASFPSSAPVVRAELNYTLDTGPWVDRFWQSAPATLDAKTHRIIADVPSDATEYYLGLEDDRGLITTSAPASSQ